MISCKQIDPIGYLEGVDSGGETAGHLQACSACRQELDVYRRLLTGLVGSPEAEEEEPLPELPLPPALQELAAERRRRWTETRLRKALSFRGITDRKAQDARIERIIAADAADDALRLAAFPDDLLSEEDQDDGDPS